LGAVQPWAAPKVPGEGLAAAAFEDTGQHVAAGGHKVRLPLPMVAGGLLAAAMVLASGLAWGLNHLLEAGLGVSGKLSWVAPAAAALGVLVAAVPLLLLTLRLRTVPSLSVPDGLPLQMGPEGVPRALFMDLAGREWARARRYGTGTALLLVQLDRFARLVEARGPEAADAALRELMRCTAPTLRAADLVTRFSECEIAVFLAHSDSMGALDVAERIRERAEQMEVMPDSLPGQKLRVTVSVGVAQLRPVHLNLHALADDAEDAVDAARQAGGNCVRAAPVETSRLRAPGSGPWRDGSKTQG
jgi:diguanylate cyclase (GGDEF)-like protein